MSLTDAQIDEFLARNRILHARDAAGNRWEFRGLTAENGKAVRVSFMNVRTADMEEFEVGSSRWNELEFQAQIVP